MFSHYKNIMCLVMEFWKTSYKNIYDIEICDFPTERETASIFWFVFFPLYMYVHVCGWRVKIHINYLKAKQELIFF